MLPLEFSSEERPGQFARGRWNCSIWSASPTAPPRRCRAELSAGQQQRVVYARALINRPTLLLADEPSSDLDQDTEREIMEIFTRIHGEQGLTVAMVTHARNLIRTRHAPPRDGRRHRTRGRGLGRPHGT